MEAFQTTAGPASSLGDGPALSRPLLIGIDIRRAGEFGVGIYTKNLVRSLARVGPEHSYVLLGGPRNREFLGDLGPNFRLVQYGRRFDSLRSHLDFWFVLRGLGLDVFHIPHRWAPLSTPAPYVVTLHDLNNLYFPKDRRSQVLERLQRGVLRRGLDRASRIITVSQATRRDAVKRLGLPDSKFTTIYDAVDEQVAQPVPPEVRKLTLERYSISDPFVLYAGRIQPQKNVPRLIEAFAVVKAQLENHWKYHHLKLIVIGDDLARYPEVRRAVMRSRLQDSVRFLGFVPLETLRCFYNEATAFLFPSLYEGFGMPPLEAMAHGTPVVTSSVSSLPESVGDAAELVNPTNVFDIARGLRKILLDDEYRSDLRKRGFEQVRKFSWDRSAEQVLEVYREVARRAL
ncbi:MAG: glycosyltransferase [Acidobacteria bacterium]|nr:glycosyltransferase [Acidobacteriota bacterium]